MDGVLVKKQKRAGIDGWSERYFRFSQNDRKLQYWKDEQDFKNNKAPRGAIIVQKLYQLPERDSGKKAHRLGDFLRSRGAREVTLRSSRR